MGSSTFEHAVHSVLRTPGHLPLHLNLPSPVYVCASSVRCPLPFSPRISSFFLRYSCNNKFEMYMFITSFHTLYSTLPLFLFHVRTFLYFCARKFSKTMMKCRKCNILRRTSMPHHMHFFHEFTILNHTSSVFSSVSHPYISRSMFNITHIVVRLCRTSLRFYQKDATIKFRP